MAHPYLTTLLALAAMLLAFVIVDYAGTQFSNVMTVANNRLKIKAAEVELSAKREAK